MTKIHTDREYERQLEEIRARLLGMAQSVDAMLADAIRALGERDVELAARTIERDHHVNRDEVETDELCLLVLAKRQPMASDLRFITLTLKMVTDLERIGDIAVNICERVFDLARSTPLPLPADLGRMADTARAMLSSAIDAFVAGDADAAQAVIDRDDEVDALYGQIFRELLAAMRDDPALTERSIHLQSIIKWLERVGDHATNLAEQVVFMVKGKDIRHIGKLDPPP